MFRLGQKCFRCPNKPKARCFECNLSLCNDCLSSCINCTPYIYICKHPRCQEKHEIIASCFACDELIEKRHVSYKFDNCCDIFCWKCRFSCKEGTYCNKCLCPHVATCPCGEESTFLLFKMKQCEISFEFSHHTKIKSTFCCSGGGTKNKQYSLYCCKDPCKNQISNYHGNNIQTCILCESKYCEKHHFKLNNKSSVIICRKYCYHQYITK